MAITQQPVKFTDFSGGMVSNLNVSLAPNSTSDLMLNLDADFEIGSAVSRLGRARVGSQLVSGKTILGVIQHVDQSDSSNNKLFAVVNDSSDNNSDIFDVVAGSISNANFTAGTKCYFLNYQGETLILNGTDSAEAFNSSSWITTGGVFDLANIPANYKFPIEFLDRVYLWGKDSSPYTLEFSGLLTSGSVSWSDGDSVEIEPEDNGGEATGLGKVPGYILVFKRRSMHRWNFSSAFPEELTNIGAYSQESIINAGGLCAFYSDSNENAKGFYVTNGGRPVQISQDSNRPINKWVDAISSSATVAGWGTERYFAWSIGDVTVDGEDYKNVVLKYNRSLNQWTVRTYPSQFSYFAAYVTGGVHTTVGGDDDGTIYRVDKADTFSDEPSTGSAVPIPYRLRTHHNTFGTNTLKTVTDEMIVRGKNIEGITMNFILDEDLDNRVPIHVSNLWKKILHLFGIGNKVNGTTIAAEVSGETEGARAYVREIEFKKFDVLANYI